MRAELHTTAYLQERLCQKREAVEFTPDIENQELHLINVYPQMSYQTVDFFGGAITDAVGDTLGKIPAEQAQKVIDAYFGKEGIGYRAIRTPIDSCDFSTEQYAASDCYRDGIFQDFSISRDRDRIIPWIKKAYEAAGEVLPVMLSPWSPPAFMKSNQKRERGGSLKREYYTAWAEYICRYIQAYRTEGIHVAALSLQNEPNATQTWDSCLYTPAQERDFLVNAMYPALVKYGLQDISVFIWDHNKERLFDRALEEIDETTDSMIDGLAFHWYSGDHFDALRLVRDKYPGKKLYFTEGCIEYSRFDRNPVRNAMMYAHDMMGNLNAGMNGFLDWNICLDEHGGPNYVANYCEAPVFCNTTSGELTVNLSFHYISHFSQFIAPGATRIGTTSYSPELEIAAFRNPDGKLVLVVLNTADRKNPVIIRLNNQLLEFQMEENSIATVVISE